MKRDEVPFLRIGAEAKAEGFCLRAAVFGLVYTVSELARTWYLRVTSYCKPRGAISS